MSSLYDQRFEHDACGIGAVIDIDGKKSHKVVDDALSIVEKLEHRAGKDASGEIGDGVGIMVQISHKFFEKAAKNLGINIGKEREYGVGMFFFSQDEFKRKQAMKMFEIIAQKAGKMLIKNATNIAQIVEAASNHDTTSRGSSLNFLFFL